MSPYSVLDISNILDICKQYTIPEVVSHIILSGGSENTNYLISTENGKFVLTICEQKTMQRARDLACLLEFLADNGFKTSELLRTTKGELISKWNGKPVMFKHFLSGHILNDFSYALLEKVGIEMGKLHQIRPPEEIQRILGYGVTHFHEVSTYAKGSDFEIWLNEIKDYILPYMSTHLPKTLIHSDIFYSNIVVSIDRKSVCIMDFEEAADYFRVFDIGMTLVGLCSDSQKMNLAKASALMSGYQKKIKLLEIEKKVLQAFTVYAAASMTFWRHRNFHHINPNPKMYDHYLELKAIADCVKEISASDFDKIFN
jgi:homoserine kinase type II